MCSLEQLVCPRCNRVVRDRHGICGNCHENGRSRCAGQQAAAEATDTQTARLLAHRIPDFSPTPAPAAHQCRVCRHINYENLDAFLCIDCGHCRFAKLNLTFSARSSTEVDPITTEADEAACLRLIEAETHKARAAQRVLDRIRTGLLYMAMAAAPASEGASIVVANVGTADGAENNAGGVSVPAALLAQARLYHGEAAAAAADLARSHNAVQAVRRAVRSNRLQEGWERARVT